MHFAPEIVKQEEERGTEHPFHNSVSPKTFSKKPNKYDEEDEIKSYEDSMKSYD